MRARMLLAPALVLVALLGLGAGTALAASAASITASEGEEFSGVVDTVSCTSVGRIGSPMINWGDGTAPSSGTVAQTGPSTCTISGNHTYGEEGSYTTTITYNNGAGNDTGSATVADVQPAATPMPFYATHGVAFSGVVATFTDVAPEPVSNYTATIDWGDGHTSTGTISSGYSVSGSHTYVYGGVYSIAITIHDEGGAEITPVSGAIVSGCPTAAPSAPSPAFKPSIIGLDPRYVQALYHDLLGRAPSAGELSSATTALSEGATRQQIVLAILQSDEYRDDLLASLYTRFLGSPPSSSTLGYLLGLSKLGASDEAVESLLLGSSQYYASPANDSNDGFLTALYCQAVFRAIDEPTQDADDISLAGGEQRNVIAANLLASNEYRAELVKSFYLRFLRRAPSPGELNSGTAFLASGSDEQLIANLLASPEYYQLVNPVASRVTTISAQGVVSTTSKYTASYGLTIFRVIPHAGDVAAVHFAAPPTRLVGVVRFGRHRKGRVVLHWNRKVGKRKLTRGNYVLVLRAYHGRKLISVSNAIPFRVR